MNTLEHVVRFCIHATSVLMLKVIIIYQEGMEVKYALTPESDGYGFEVGAYDKTLASIDIEYHYQQRREG